MKAFESAIPVSETLRAMAAETPAQGADIGGVLEQLGQEGRFVAIMLLTAPFLLPVSLPGMSTPFGILILLLCGSLLTDRKPQLPRRLRTVRIKQQHMLLVASRAAPILRRLEGWCKPRLIWLTDTAALRRLHLFGMIAGTVGMMLPLPMPLSNAIPAYAIICHAMGLLRRDGVMIALGYALLLATLLYFIVVYAAGAAVIRMLLSS